MDLGLWIPLTVAIGLAIMFLLLAFTEACDRV